MSIDILAVVWISAAVVFGIAEAITMGLTTIWFAGGAVAAAVSAMFTDSILIQVIVFIAVSSALLAVTRPLVKKFINRKIQPTNADMAIGKTAIVTVPVNNEDGTGEVKLNGTVWTARSENGIVIGNGKRVKVLRIEGVKLIVEEI